MANFDEVAGEDVQEETADEFRRRHSGGIGAACAKDHGLVVRDDQPRVADGHTIGVLLAQLIPTPAGSPGTLA